MMINPDVPTDPNHKAWRMQSALSRVIDRADNLLEYMEGYEKDWNNGEPLPAFETLRQAIAEGKEVIVETSNALHNTEEKTPCR